MELHGRDGDDEGGDGPRQRRELHLPGARCERGGQGRGVGADAGGDAGGTGADGLVRVGAGSARREQCVRAAPRVQRERGGAFSEYAERHLRGDGRGVDGPAPGGPAPGPVDRDGDTVVGRCGDGGGAGKPCLRCVGGGVHGGRRAAVQPSGGNGPRPSTDGVGECGAGPGDGRHGGGLHAHAHGRHGGRVDGDGERERGRRGSCWYATDGGGIRGGLGDGRSWCGNAGRRGSRGRERCDGLSLWPVRATRSMRTPPKRR